MKLILSTALALMATSTAYAADLTLTVTGMKTDTGNVMIGVYDKADRFLQVEGIVARGRVPASHDAVTYVFKNLAPGQYAISIFHDANNNGKLDKNFMGIPTEPIGMSRDAKGSFGPPRYEDAVFSLPADGMSMTIKVE
ncbi:MAG: DUF2141 domain-containing protein [Alphaproteobacteria bacterium]|nr:MAG: DUF2141 domain-containing protein [Alphaproteobacteria bacterium]